MTDNYKKEISLSLHMFRLLVESKCNKSTDKNYAKKQRMLLKTAGINQSLSNKYCDEIRKKCYFLGRCGWAISPFWEPAENETWYDTWFWMAYNDSSDKITDYFLNDNHSLLNNINGYSRFEVARRDWFMEAETLFSKKYYTSCAMLLTAILEQSIRKCPIDAWKYKTTVFFNNAVNIKIEDYYNKNIEPLSQYIETVLILPSIDGFINNYYDSGNRFENGKEPSFLERNWLMHGLTKRTVTESDCVKLFNVVCSLHYALHTVFETFYGQ